MSNIIKGITQEDPITKKEPEVHVPGYGTIPLDMLKRHVQSLSKDFDTLIQQGAFLKAAYRSEQFYNALMALAKALPKPNKVDEGDLVSLHDEQKLLSKLVKDWWHGNENEHAKATMMFAKMGYEPYEDGDEIVLAKGDDEVRFHMDDIIEGYSAGAVGGAGLGEDTAYAGGMGQGGNAGQSYRKFKPKPAGTKESAIMKGLTK